MKVAPVLLLATLALIGASSEVCSANKYPPGPGGSCPDTLLIERVQNPVGSCHPVSPDTVLGIAGVVIAVDAIGPSYGVYIQDPNPVTYGGVLLFTGQTDWSTSAQAIAVGDVVAGYGVVIEFQGETQIHGPDADGTTNDIVLRRVATGASQPEVLWGPAFTFVRHDVSREPYEGMLIEARGRMRVARVDQGAGDGIPPNSFLAATLDSAVTDSVLVDGGSLTTLAPPPLGTELVSVRGVLNQRSTDAQNSYRIQLRNAADLSFALDAEFSATPSAGAAPLVVQFQDLSSGFPTSWAWDFEDDGIVDATTPAPQHTYSDSGAYVVRLTIEQGGSADSQVHTITALHEYADTLIVPRFTIAEADTFELPIRFHGRDSLGAVSLYFEYESAKLQFLGVGSRVSGETFTAGLVGGRISVQWFDETGGIDPITPDEDTLFVIRFRPVQSTDDSTTVRVHRGLSALADPRADPITDVRWLDDPPGHGVVVLDIPLQISGTITYYATGAAVPGAQIHLTPSGPDGSTDASGAYVLGPVDPGNHTLRASKTTDLGGINSLDAVKVVRHGAGIELLTNPNAIKAGNVNGDGSVNSLDALKIVRAAIGIETLPSGNWKFVPDSLTYTPLVSTATGQNLLGVRMGDVNGSWVPDPAAPVLLRAQTSNAAVTAAFPDTAILASAPTLDLPVYVGGFTNIGAVSLRVGFPGALLTPTQVTSQVSGVSFFSNVVGEEIRIEWYDPSGGSSPIQLGSGVLLVVRFTVHVQESHRATFTWGPATALGDAAGNPISGATFRPGSCALVASSSTPARVPAVFALGPGQPNPFRDHTDIVFDLPSAGRTRLTIFGVDGRKVADLLDRELSPGSHRARWRPAAAPPGIYFARLAWGREVLWRRLILTR